MSRLQEQAKNLGITEDQYREFKVSGLSEDEYKELIKDSKDTILTKEEQKELKDIIEENEKYTILDYIRDKKAPAQNTKDAEKFEEQLLNITPIEILEKEEKKEITKKEYDRVNIKMEKELYDKVLYTAYRFNKDVTSFVNEVLSRYLEKIEVEQDIVDEIRAKNKSRRAGDK